MYKTPPLHLASVKGLLSQACRSKSSSTQTTVDRELPKQKHPGLVLTTGPSEAWDHTAVGNPVVCRQFLHSMECITGRSIAVCCCVNSAPHVSWQKLLALVVIQATDNVPPAEPDYLLLCLDSDQLFFA